MAQPCVVAPVFFVCGSAIATASPNANPAPSPCFICTTPSSQPSPTLPQTAAFWPAYRLANQSLARHAFHQPPQLGSRMLMVPGQTHRPIPSPRPSPILYAPGKLRARGSLLEKNRSRQRGLIMNLRTIILLLLLLTGCAGPTPIKPSSPVPPAAPISKMTPAPPMPLPKALAVFSSVGGTVTLAWSPGPITPTNPAPIGFRIYQGAASRSYTNSIDVGNVTSFQVQNLITNSTYFFAATSYKASGIQSDFSNEVSYKVPAQKKTVAVITSIIETNSTLSTNTWIQAYTYSDVTIPVYADPQFYRVHAFINWTNTP